MILHISGTYILSTGWSNEFLEGKLLVKILKFEKIVELQDGSAVLCYNVNKLSRILMNLRFPIQSLMEHPEGM